MIFRKPRLDEQTAYEHLTQHPLQSWAWGDFREATGVETRRLIGFDGSNPVGQMQVTFHPIPQFPYTVGYYPRGVWPDDLHLQTLIELGKLEKAIFIKIEPDVSHPPYSEADITGLEDFLLSHGCVKGKPMFTPWSFVIDLTKTEDQLMELMKPKTRYNIKVAQKHGVQVSEDNSEEAFETYLRLLRITTQRQEFYAHSESYQRKMWAAMRGAGIAHLLKAEYQGKVITTWILFHYKHRLFYPYGASSREHRNVMASNLVMWDAIRLGKAWGCKSMDLWGALGPNPDPNDPWFGFHNFKEGYGGDLARFVGSYDLIIDPNLYKVYRAVDRWRWKWLKFKSKFKLFR